MQQLPPQQRGELFLGLWGYAMIVTAANGAVVVSLIRVGWRVSRCGDYRPLPMAKAAWSPALGAATALLVAGQLTQPLLRRKLESWIDTRASEPAAAT